jgi:hypothetical protein
VRVLLSTNGGRGGEPLVALAVRFRALGAEVRVCALVTRSAIAVQQSTAASELSR